jgi:flagellar biosynthesis chaperone FliJ
MDIEKLYKKYHPGAAANTEEDARQDLYKCMAEIKQLQSQLAAVTADRDQCRDLIDEVRQENADYLAGTLEGRLKSQLAAAEKREQVLRDAIRRGRRLYKENKPTFMLECWEEALKGE